MDSTSSSFLNRLPPSILRQIVLYILPRRLAFGGKTITTAATCPENPLLSLILAIPSYRGLLDALLFGTCRFEFNGDYNQNSSRHSSEVAMSFFKKVGSGKMRLVKWLQLNPLSISAWYVKKMERRAMLDLLRELAKFPRLGHHRTTSPCFTEVTPAPVIGSELPQQPLYYALQESVRPRLAVPIRSRLRSRKGRFLRSRRVSLNELNEVLQLHIQTAYPVNFTIELPLELRRTIYGHLMSDAPTRCEVTEQCTRGFGQNNAFASSLRINQEVRHELSQLLYRNCLFHFQHSTNSQDWNRANKIKDTAPWCSDFLRSIGNDNASNIRNVRIELTISEHYPYYTPPILSLVTSILTLCGLESGPGPQYVQCEGSAVQGDTRVFFVDFAMMTKGQLQVQTRTPWTWPDQVPFRRSGRLQWDAVMEVLVASLRGLNSAITTQGLVTTR